MLLSADMWNKLCQSDVSNETGIEISYLVKEAKQSIHFTGTKLSRGSSIVWGLAAVTNFLIMTDVAMAYFTQLYWTKESNCKRIHIIWLHLYEVQNRQNTAVMTEIRTKLNSGYLNSIAWKGGWGKVLKYWKYSMPCFVKTH